MLLDRINSPVLLVPELALMKSAFRLDLRHDLEFVLGGVQRMVFCLSALLYGAIGAPKTAVRGPGIGVIDATKTSES